MLSLTLEHILQLHVLVIKKYGGSAGVRDIGRLESALASQKQTVFGSELYPDVKQKAAVLMRNIIVDNPFVDGNNRTASLAALTLLELNGHTFIAKEGELEDFAVRVAVEQLNVEDIADWISTYSTQPE